MIIADIVEHVEMEKEQIYLLREEKGRTVVYITAIIEGEFRTLSKSYATRELALREIRQLEGQLDAKDHMANCH